MVFMSSMMVVFTGVKLYSLNSFPLLQMIPLILPTVSLAAEKKSKGFCCYLWCNWLIMIVQFIEQGQVVLPTGSMIKGSRPFYWILLKEANLLLMVDRAHDQTSQKQYIRGGFINTSWTLQ